jgi:hypothetical protein
MEVLARMIALRACGAILMVTRVAYASSGILAVSAASISSLVLFVIIRSV